MATKKKETTKAKAKEEPVTDNLPNTIGELDELCAQLWEQIAVETDKKKKAALILEYNTAAGKCNRLAQHERMTIITKTTLITATHPGADEPESSQPAKTNSKQSKAEKQAALKAVAAKHEEKAIAAGDDIRFCFAGGSVLGTVTKLCEDGSLLVDAVRNKRTFHYHIEPWQILKDDETPQSIASRKPGNTHRQQSSSAAPRTPKAPREAPPPKRSEPQKMKMTAAIKKILDGEGSGADKIRAVYDLDPKGFDTEDFVILSGISRSRIKGCLDKFRYPGWENDKK